MLARSFADSARLYISLVPQLWMKGISASDVSASRRYAHYYSDKVVERTKWSIFVQGRQRRTKVACATLVKTPLMWQRCDYHRVTKTHVLVGASPHCDVAWLRQTAPFYFIWLCGTRQDQGR